MLQETFTIEAERSQGKTEFWVWGHSVYPRSSVLAGQARRRRVRCFDSAEQAQVAYPAAKLSGGSHAANREDSARFARLPAPADFDPADAGESWDGDY